MDIRRYAQQIRVNCPQPIPVMPEHFTQFDILSGRFDGGRALARTGIAWISAPLKGQPPRPPRPGSTDTDKAHIGKFYTRAGRRGLGRERGCEIRSIAGSPPSLLNLLKFLQVGCVNGTPTATIVGCA